MKWLDDKPLNGGNMTINFRMKRTRGRGYVIISFSKSLKEYISETGSTHIRFGWDEIEYNQQSLLLQLNNEEKGLPLLNDKGNLRLWLNVDSYYNQYVMEDVKIPLNRNLKVTVREDGILESMLPKIEY